MKTPQVLILLSLLVLVASAPLEKRNKVDVLKGWENYTHAECKKISAILKAATFEYVRVHYNLPEGNVSCWKGKKDIIFSFEVMDEGHVLKKVLFEKITLKDVESYFKNRDQAQNATVMPTRAAPVVMR